MTDPTPEQRRRRWISLGEFIALAALIVSGLGLWNSWQGSKSAGPTEVVEKKQAIPMILRGTVEDGGKTLRISPTESSHTLELLTLNFPGGRSLNIENDGMLSARELAAVLGTAGEKKGDASIVARSVAHYVEAGQWRQSSRNYVIRYRVESGGLFGGTSIRLTGFASN